MRQDVHVNISDAAEKEMLAGLTPTGDEEEDDEAEMVPESQGRKSSAPSDQVRLKSEAARINIFRSDISIFQTMHPADEEDEEEMLKRAIAISLEEQ